MSSMEMKTVITLRRNRNPATPRVNRIALRIRYQASGTLWGKGISGMLFDLLAGKHDCAENRDQDQDAGDFKGQHVNIKQSASELLRIPVCHGAELHAFSDWQHPLNDERDDPDEDRKQRNAGEFHPQAARQLLLLTGVQQHDDEDEQHHDGAGVDDQLRGGDEFSAKQEIESGERSHDANQREGARNGVRLYHYVDAADHGDRGKEQEENRVHSYLEVSATIRAVTKRLTIATGNSTVQAKFIS